VSASPRIRAPGGLPSTSTAVHTSTLRETHIPHPAAHGCMSVGTRGYRLRGPNPPVLPPAVPTGLCSCVSPCTSLARGERSGTQGGVYLPERPCVPTGEKPMYLPERPCVPTGETLCTYWREAVYLLERSRVPTGEKLSSNSLLYTYLSLIDCKEDCTEDHTNTCVCHRVAAHAGGSIR
jgi:hypothetical protein